MAFNCLKKIVRLWDDIQRFGVLTKTTSVQVFSAIFPWCLHSVYVCGQSLSRVWLLVNPWTEPRQAPLSMGILQARILEWVAMPYSRRSSQPRDQTQVAHIAIFIWVLLKIEGKKSNPKGKCQDYQGLPPLRRNDILDPDVSPRSWFDPGKPQDLCHFCS